MGQKTLGFYPLRACSKNFVNATILNPETPRVGLLTYGMYTSQIRGVAPTLSNKQTRCVSPGTKNRTFAEKLTIIVPPLTRLLAYRTFDL